jgi:hypothetical protein
MILTIQQLLTIKAMKSIPINNIIANISNYPTPLKLKSTNTINHKINTIAVYIIPIDD